MTLTELNDRFAARVQEVELFFTRLQEADQRLAAGDAPPHEAEWVCMLKGSAYLLLYNLVEAFVRLGFKTLFTLIETDGLTADLLKATYADQWMRQRMRLGIDPYDGAPVKYVERAIEVIKLFRQNGVAKLSAGQLPVSGNLDQNIIGKVFKQFGLDLIPSAEARGGHRLVDVKKNRNYLGHGEKSFTEVGRDLSYDDLEKAKDCVVHYMRSALDCIGRACTTRHFAAEVNPPPGA